jgi:hypothetical protein
LVLIAPVLQPFKELLKQNLFLNRTDVALSIRSNSLLVLGFEGKIGGMHGLDALEKAHHDECCESNSSQWICPLVQTENAVRTIS